MGRSVFELYSKRQTLQFSRELLNNLKIYRIPPRPPTVKNHLRLPTPIRKPNCINCQNRVRSKQSLKKISIVSALAENPHPPTHAVTETLRQLCTACKKRVHPPSINHQCHDVAGLDSLVEGNVLESWVLFLQFSNTANNSNI